MRYATISLAIMAGLLILAGLGYTASLIHIEGNATFRVSFNEPKKTVEDAAIEDLSINLPDISPIQSHVKGKKTHGG